MNEPYLIERITRSLAFMLRHQPDQFDLELDKYGYADLDEVVRALNEKVGEPVEAADVEEAVHSSGPRYEIDGDKIRALYGHSIAVDPGSTAKPPEILYVAIPEGDVDRAQRFGLRGGRRRFLHLALSQDQAIESGRRMARDYTVLSIQALDAWEEGVNFYDRNSLWLAEEVPTHLLDIEETYHDGTDPIRRGREGGRRDERGGQGGRGGRGGRDRGGRGRGRGRRDERGGRDHVGRDRDQDRSPDERGRALEVERSESRQDAGGERSRSSSDDRDRGSGRGRGRGRDRGGRGRDHRGERPARSDGDRPERERPERERPERERSDRDRPQRERSDRDRDGSREPRRERPAATEASSSQATATRSRPEQRSSGSGFGAGLVGGRRPAPAPEPPAPKPAKEPKPEAKPKRDASPPPSGPGFGAGL